MGRLTLGSCWQAILLAALIGSSAIVVVSPATLCGQMQLADALPATRDAEYVSAQRCLNCHPDQHASWHRSFHRTMTQPATPENVVGDFNGTTIDSDGLKYRVFRRGDEFWAEMPDPEILMYAVQGGQRVDQLTYLVKRSPDAPVERFDLRDIPRVERRVVMTTGSHHYQTYWVPGDSRQYGNLLQSLPLVYLIEDQRWIPREDAFMYPPDSHRMVTQWNHHCIRCHSTGGIPGLTPEGKFATRVGELGISCEACHGPGQAHVRRQEQLLHSTGNFQADNQKPIASLEIVNPAKLNHERSSQVCGQCHGVFVMPEETGLAYARSGILYRPGDDLFQTRYYIQHPKRDSTPGRQEDLRRNAQFFRVHPGISWSD